MGKFTRSENSLNQHLKIKHPELWSKIKVADESRVDKNSQDKSCISGNKERESSVKVQESEQKSEDLN